MPHILCAGIAVLDEVFHVREFPAPDTKAEATEFFAVGGGNAANAAVAIARLGARVAFAGPIGGPAGEDAIGDRVIKGLAAEGIDTGGCVRLAGTRTPISAILLNAQGERTIANHRDKRLDAVTPPDPARLVADIDVLLVDNRYPTFVTPICRSRTPTRPAVVIDADKATVETDPLFALGTHVIFSGDCLRRTTGIDDLAAGLARMAQFTDAFLAATNGPLPVLWREERRDPGHAGVRNGRDRYARGRRCFPRRLHADACRGPRDRRVDALRCRRGRIEVHAVRRRHRGAAPRRGRGAAGQP